MKIFHIKPIGNMGNHMIQYMVALSLLQKIPECHLSNVALKSWGIEHPVLPHAKKTYRYREVHHFDTEYLAAILNYGIADRIVYSGYGQRVENFLSREFYRQVFQCPIPHPDKLGFDESHLVINIRGEEILDGHHRDYVLLPLVYYEEILEKTGLKPVFVGQLGDNAYCDGLRKHFTDALFIKSRGAMHDFHTIRYSRNIIPAISTFSWLACYLSCADQIFMPLAGIFNPLQRPDVNYVLSDDESFTYTLFPVYHAVHVAKHQESHHAIHGKWRAVTPEEVYATRPIACYP